jgi:hypothetical protein
MPITLSVVWIDCSIQKNQEDQHLGYNGPHFHCIDFFDSLKMNTKKFGIEIELDFFEVGEGKSDLDRHFGAAKQSVRRRVTSSFATISVRKKQLQERRTTNLHKASNSSTSSSSLLPEVSSKSSSSSSSPSPSTETLWEPLQRQIKEASELYH